jgi:hydroxyacid-oxoacid transhydrogenase
MIPQGMSVILNSPAVFRYTAPSCPERHLRAAEALGTSVARANARDAGRILADRVTDFMQRLKMPNGLHAVGYGSGDIGALVRGTLPQHRVTRLSPRQAGEEGLARLFEDALVAW